MSSKFKNKAKAKAKTHEEAAQVKTQAKINDIKNKIKFNINLDFIKKIFSSVNIGLAKSDNETDMQKAVRLGTTLFAVTAITGLLLGLVEWGTRDAILATRANDKSDALQNVMPEAVIFNNFKQAELNETITDVQEALNDKRQRVGWCVSVSSKGYGGLVNFVVGIKADGSVRAINILSHSETPGLGAKSTEPEFYTQFNNRDKLPLKVVKGAASNPDEIAAISGATVTSNAVTNGVNEAVNYFNQNLAALSAKN
ncbi:MAG: RnfABCDGE type electron transport complex subunit G [Synergistaceae bacterium]|nr:RnfABCDGE type electron transport complex subunit G [Synergistaceae bacterium]MBR1418008.1 RnfABCDGE type electron transport complex subunit G [Synergistaceae bacterium]